MKRLFNVLAQIYVCTSKHVSMFHEYYYHFPYGAYGAVSERIYNRQLRVQNNSLEY